MVKKVSIVVGKGRIPYWKRAHHDWKYWLAILLMLVAIIIYVKTNDLSARPHPQMQQIVP
ncbi:MAG: hypothetical protein ACYDA4_15060 [Ignavibacteriaceae bacterium]